MRATLFTQFLRENSLIIDLLSYATFVRAFHSSFELRLVKVKKDSKASFSFHERRESLEEASRAGPRSFRIVGETREEARPRRRRALSRPEEACGRIAVAPGQEEGLCGRHA